MRWVRGAADARAAPRSGSRSDRPIAPAGSRPDAVALQAGAAFVASEARLAARQERQRLDDERAALGSSVWSSVAGAFVRKSRASAGTGVVDAGAAGAAAAAVAELPSGLVGSAPATSAPASAATAATARIDASGADGSSARVSDGRAPVGASPAGAARPSLQLL